MAETLTAPEKTATKLPPPGSDLTLAGVSKSFGSVQAVTDVTLQLRRGRLLTLIGPSGCGKTTLLRLIAGLEVPDRGEIRIGSTIVAGNGTFVPPERRDAGVVFQDYALFPHLNVLQNVTFGLMRLPRGDREGRAREMLAAVGLQGLEERYAHQLSGGQQQRVALARALAPRPTLLLLDEPLSNLDAHVRTQMRHELQTILAEQQVSALLVTHDQEEALSMADDVAVLRGGRLEQVGSPEEVYRRPRTAFVAAFLGATNLLPGRARDGVVETPLGPVRAPTPDGPTTLSLRPEDLRIADQGLFRGEIVRRSFRGHDVNYVVRVGEVLVNVLTDCHSDYYPGDRVALELVGQPVPLGEALRRGGAGND
jgi:iron(III) transport system ATP-binding protein